MVELDGGHLLAGGMAAPAASETAAHKAPSKDRNRMTAMIGSPGAGGPSANAGAGSRTYAYMIRPYQSIDSIAASTANSAAAAANSAVISVCRCSNTSFELSDS